jgi:hypothetical protein
MVVNHLSQIHGSDAGQKVGDLFNVRRQIPHEGLVCRIDSCYGINYKDED